MNRRFVLFVIVIAALLVVQARSQPDRAPATLPVYAPDGTPITGVHIVVGSAAVPAGGATVTFSGAAIFAGRDTYRCFTSIERGPVPGNPQRIDGTRFTLPIGTSAGGWTEDFLCIGK